MRTEELEMSQQVTSVPVEEAGVCTRSVLCTCDTGQRESTAFLPTRDLRVCSPGVGHFFFLLVP